MIQTGVRISEDMNDDIESLVLALDISKQEVIRRAIKEYCSSQKTHLFVGREMKGKRKPAQKE